MCLTPAAWCQRREYLPHPDPLNCQSFAARRIDSKISVLLQQSNGSQDLRAKLGIKSTVESNDAIF
jgi:hypothetical protein